MSDAISEIVQVTITAATAVPTQQGFGVPMLMAFHTHNTDLFRIYTSLSAMVADGFTTGEPAYLMAAAVFSQNPSPPSIMIGRITGAATARTFTLTSVDATVGNVATMTMTGKDGVPHVVTRTIPAASTTTLEATAVAALITTALGALGAAAAVAAVITVTPTTPGDKIFVSANNVAEYTYIDTAAAVGYAAMLNTLLNANANWYGLAIQDMDTVNLNAVAAWAEANPVLFVGNATESLEITATGGNIGAAWKAAAYKRSGLLWTGSPQNYSAAAWLGAMLPYLPGQATWMFKTLTGVAVDALTPTQRSNLDTNNTNHYDPIAGINITRYGQAGGSQYLDITVLIDWTSSRMKSAVYGALVNPPKIPYTDVGIAVITGAMGSVLDQGVRNGGFAEGTTSVVPQKVANATTADKANRILQNMLFSARMAGAIHKVVISGTLSV